MRKVTVSLPEETAHGVEALVQAGQAASFSAYVAAAATASLERDRALAELREHTGGPRGESCALELPGCSAMIPPRRPSRTRPT